MASSSVYVHSTKKNANLSVSVDMIDNIQGRGDFEGISYIQSTINKLEKIKLDLQKAEDEFLQGYSIDAAQDMADREGKDLIQLASRILYGSDSQALLSALTLNQNIKSKELIQQLDNSALSEKIKQYLLQNTQISVSNLTTFLVNELSGGRTELTVTEAGTAIRTLGKIFDVQTIKTSFRKTAEQKLTDEIFKTTKDTIKTKGVFQKMIKDLLKTSNYTTLQRKGSAINSFCNKLNKLMKKEAENMVFIWGNDPKKIDKRIDKFTNDLKNHLYSILNENKMVNRSNVGGVFGEEVRESIYKAANSIIIQWQVGDLSESKVSSEINQRIKKYGSDLLSEMVTHHDVKKQSQTDLIMVNTRTGKVARAQSKNHIISYFENGGKNSVGNEIDNFRWMVEESVELLSFMSNLSDINKGTGMSLNDFDMSNIFDALANNLWQRIVGSYTGGGRGKIEFEGKSGIDFKQELEGSLEKLLAGQVTNFLGVTLQKKYENIGIVAGGSNLFYLLNGRMKRCSDLIGQAIDQMVNNQLKGLVNEKGRLVNVTLTGMNLEGVDQHGKSFLVGKFKEDAESIGEAKGQEIIDNIKISVSLGTSIDKLANTSLVLF